MITARATSYMHQPKPLNAMTIHVSINGFIPDIGKLPTVVSLMSVGLECHLFSCGVSSFDNQTCIFASVCCPNPIRCNAHTNRGVVAVVIRQMSRTVLFLSVHLS